MQYTLNSSQGISGTNSLKFHRSILIGVVRMKKVYVLLIGFIVLSVQVFGQEKAEPILSEFSISVNWSNPMNDFTTKNIGFGIGAYHPFFSKHTANLIVGIEYNRTSQFVKYIHAGHNYSAYDLTYIINSISIPIGLRINIGKKNKFFFETGGFADLTISSNENVGSCVGIYFGMGFMIPVSKFELIIKPEAKAGLHDLNNYGVHTSYIRLSVGLRI